MIDRSAPRIGPLWIAVWKRNLRVWWKLAGPAIVGNFGEPILFLVGLGYGLGSFVGQVEGLSYLAFLASGIVCSSTMNAATFEGLYSAFTRMSVQQTWGGMLCAPLSVDDIVFGEMVWCGTKSLFSGIAILVVAAVLGVIREPTVLWVVPVILLVGVCFGALALVVTAFASTYDFFLYYFTLVVTPMFLLSGVFFPLHGLPDALQWAVWALPLAHAVAVVRPLMTGLPLEHVVLHLAVLAFYALLGLYLATVLMRRRLLA